MPALRRRGMPVLPDKGGDARQLGSSDIPEEDARRARAAVGRRLPVPEADEVLDALGQPPLPPRRTLPLPASTWAVAQDPDGSPVQVVLHTPETTLVLHAAPGLTPSQELKVWRELMQSVALACAAASHRADGTPPVPDSALAVLAADLVRRTT